MQDYQPNVHYDIHDLTMEQRVLLLREAKEDAFEWRVDVLDCSVSSARQQVTMPFEEIMAKFDRACHFVVIHRRGYADRKTERDSMWHWHLEVGFCTMGLGNSYYLWLLLPEALVEKYTIKYNLTQH